MDSMYMACWRNMDESVMSSKRKPFIVLEDTSNISNLQIEGRQTHITDM